MKIAITGILAFLGPIFIAGVVLASYLKLPSSFSAQQWAILFTMLNGISLIYYIAHIVNNKYIKLEEKIVWCLAIFFAFSFGMIGYWIMHMLNDE